MRNFVLAITLVLVSSCTRQWSQTQDAYLPTLRPPAVATTVATTIVETNTQSPTATQEVVTEVLPNETPTLFVPTDTQVAPAGTGVVVVPTVTVVPASATPIRSPTQTSLGNVEYGIHILNPNMSAGYAAQLGVKIVKLQVRWAEIADCNSVNFAGLDQEVQNVSSQGLKVLLSVVTAPPCYNAVGSSHFPPDDPQNYATLVGTLAGRYEGSLWGIEVWNEQNLDREWGVPDPAKYQELLRASYTAIKATNPSVVVILGALAPTWHNPPQHWDDLVYFQSLSQLGASGFADCVGVHVNSLSFPPSARSSDGIYSVDGNTHHSWYFYDTVWGSYQAFGGALPVCITEFGVATPGAVGGLPPNFGWGNNTTLEQQAQWLVEGMSLSEQWGIVKAMIFWNLDFSPSCGGCIDEKSGYSILGPNHEPLPAYDAIKRLLSP